jgi:hypothetical protein
MRLANMMAFVELGLRRCFSLCESARIGAENTSQRNPAMPNEITNSAIAAMAERLRDIGDHARFEPHMHHNAADMLTALLAEREYHQDKIDGLSSDLDSAIEVMLRRVSGEADVASMGKWLGLNYPEKDKP